MKRKKKKLDLFKILTFERKIHTLSMTYLNRKEHRFYKTHFNATPCEH